MSKVLKMFLFLVIATAACAAPTGEKIALSRDESAQASKILAHRQDLSLRVGQTQNKFQEDMDRLNEEAAKINLESQQLVLAIKKSHFVDPIVNYRLDEINGVLIKVP